MQRHDVASTLRRRCIDVMCLLGFSCYCSKPETIWVVHCEKGSSGICKQRGPRSDCATVDCAYAQSDQGPRCPQTELVDTTKCIYENRAKANDTFVHACNDVNPHILRIVEGTFSLKSANMNRNVRKCTF